MGGVYSMNEMINSLKTLSYGLEGRERMEDLDVDGEIIYKQILERYGGRVWTGLILLRIWIIGRVLCTRQ
jgi:hypothetical protein